MQSKRYQVRFSEITRRVFQLGGAAPPQTLPHSPKLEVNLRVRVHPSTILATSVIVSLFTGYKSVVTVGKQRRIHQNFCCSCWLPLFPRNTHRFATQ